MEKEFKNAGKNIKTLQINKGLTQAELAKKLGICGSGLSKKLNSKNPHWSFSEALELSRVFGISMEQIFLTKLLPFGNETKRTSNTY